MGFHGFRLEHCKNYIKTCPTRNDSDQSTHLPFSDQTMGAQTGQSSLVGRLIVGFVV